VTQTLTIATGIVNAWQYDPAELAREFAELDDDRQLDTVVPQGTPALLAQAARAHIDAGADHVCLQTVGVRGLPRAEWTALAAALLRGPSEP
jgi:hypothetical protein